MTLSFIKGHSSFMMSIVAEPFHAKKWKMLSLPFLRWLETIPSRTDSIFSITYLRASQTKYNIYAKMHLYFSDHICIHISYWTGQKNLIKKPQQQE